MKSKTKKILFFSLLSILLLAGGSYAGYHGYVSARHTRLLKQAKQYLANANQKKAAICLKRLLRYDPKDVEACRLMAELSGSLRSPSALMWRSRVVELNPRSTEDRLALAQTALACGDYTAATNALAGVSEANKKTVAYHNLAGAIAGALRRTDEAEQHFQAAAQLDTQNELPRLNLAVARLINTNLPAWEEARRTLQQISSNPTNGELRCLALRELIADAIRSQQTNAALAFSGQLFQQTNSGFRDRLLRLDILRATHNAELEPTLAASRREAGTNAAHIHALATWEMAKLSPAETLSWLRSLPLDLQTNQPVALLTAECLTMLRDWKGLQDAMDKQSWAELELLRHSFKARALRGQELTGAAKAEWELALKGANNQLVSLTMLLRLAAQWNWLSEAEELLWNIVNRYPDQKWAVQTLNQSLLANGRTRPLMMLYSQESKRSPANLDLKNNLAMTALLLEAKEVNPYDVAREIYEKAPTNAVFASTYAFSLYLQQRNAEALKVMDQLPSQVLQSPSIAGYYALILQATGHSEKAKTYLALASKAQLLPEERKLFDRARAGA